MTPPSPAQTPLSPAARTEGQPIKTFKSLLLLLPPPLHPPFHPVATAQASDAPQRAETGDREGGFEEEKGGEEQIKRKREGGRGGGKEED